MKKLPLYLLVFLSLVSCVKKPVMRETVRTAYYPGAFELFVIPKPYNLLTEEDIVFAKWKSHIPIGGTYVEREHRGTDHGLPYAYDTHVPLVLYGEEFIQKGKSQTLSSPTDIAPTMAKFLSLSEPSYAAGKPLLESLKKTSQKPAVILFVVLDQVGWGYWNHHADHIPFLSEIMEKGFVYENARLDYVPSVTAVSHAVFGTGAFPRVNGIVENKPFNSGLNRKYKAYFGPRGTHPQLLKEPTIADRWDVATQNQAKILAYASVHRASIGLGGHGLDYLGGDADVVLWHGGEKDGFVTDSQIYRIPTVAKKFRFSQYISRNQDFPYWRKQTCRYEGKGHQGALFGCWKGSPAFTQMEGDMLNEVLVSEKVGQDDVTDLVLVNFKATDYCGHYLGSESLECRETLSESDRQLKRIFNLLYKHSKGNIVLIVSADHGVAPLTEISGGKILDLQKLTKDLEKRFDHMDNDVSPISGVTKTNIHVNLSELRANGFSIEDMKRYLLGYEVEGTPFFQAVFTYKELESVD